MNPTGQNYASIVKRMTDYLPSSDLQFLMELSIEPVAAQLGLIGDSKGAT